VHYGMFVPNFGPFADPRLVADLAAECEAAGWDGLFVWDHILFSAEHTYPVGDPWVLMAAAACATRRIRLGAILTPLARRRPWKVARETVSLDHLSEGRLVFAVGLGDPPVPEFGRFGEEQSARIRAAKLDEGLAILDSLWSGRETTFRGEHYQVGPVTFLPTPVQTPRMPVWVGGWWPNKPPFRRAARWDGVVPELVGGGVPSPADIAGIVHYVGEFRTSGSPFDVAINAADCWGRRADFPAYAEAGLTWWLERIAPDRAFSAAGTRDLIRRGPPA
jgi:Luciferase-like monooxygenase